jgi:hypothetical protein
MVTERDGVEIYFLEYTSLFFSFFLKLWPPRTFLAEFSQPPFPSAAYAGKLVQYRPRGREEVVQTQTLEAFHFQASQTVSGTALVVFLKQVKMQNFKKHLEACHQLIDEALLLLVIPLMCTAVVGVLMVNLWPLVVENSQISVVLA